MSTYNHFIKQVLLPPVEPSQFRSIAFVRTLKNNGLLGSMGRVGAAGDNARMESFHSLLQNNVLDTKKWESRDELRMAIGAAVGLVDSLAN